MSINDAVRKMPLAKLLVLCYTIFTCTLVVLDVTTSCQLTDVSADLLKWIGSTVIISYFGKSAFEHKVNHDNEKKVNHE